MRFRSTFSNASKTFLGLAAVAALAGAARADVLDDVKAHGVVKCGVTLAAPGFSAEDNAGKREGFDVDLCKAIAAAALGDETKIQLVPMDLKTAFAGLPTGAVDVLTHRFTWTQSRDVGGLKFAKVMFFDGQGFAVTKKSKANKIADLNNATICTAQGSTSELIVADYFRGAQAQVQDRDLRLAGAGLGCLRGQALRRRHQRPLGPRRAAGQVAEPGRLQGAGRDGVERAHRADRGAGPAALGSAGSLHAERAGGRRGAGRHAGECRRAAQLAEPRRAAPAGRHRRLRRQARRRPTTGRTRRSRRWATTAKCGTATSAPRRRCAWSAGAMRSSPMAA